MSDRAGVAAVNQLTAEEFVLTFSRVVESYPAAAAQLCQLRPFRSTQHIVDSLAGFLESLAPADQEEVLRLHTDLAGSPADGDEGRLTAESAREQRAAGLLSLSARDRQELTQLNHRYKMKFGFPFVICARENKVATILEGLKTRLGNTRRDELEAGIAEVKKISALRIRELTQSTQDNL
ncbi:2-oxo-4-hydroxy-4-carboxy-5-ureidoimidazoline decarboxylase-like [Bacillus rossius redtenbacheri]|uniref:2-oxo-4-hydroxy-4-carboxy-5-ureidoimidazoline decarboxylase-like n=1 Tax=Bacillus rossius redtenbacheri TaxID=93214 RepID=UPI002FDEAEEB